MKKRINLLSVIVLIFIIVFFAFNTFLLNGRIRFPLMDGIINILNLRIQKCSMEKLELEVKGSSLYPLINSGQDVEVLFGYYDCHLIERGDVVLVRYAGNDNLLIKIAKGLPEDRFELKEKNTSWNIFINGNTLKNSENKNYLINNREYQMLSLYEKDYNHRIPKNAYLVLGNKETGSVDSTHFGLIDKSNIVAKVLY